MLYFIIGLPGIFTQWCEKAVVRLTGGAPVIHASQPAEITRALLGHKAGNVVIIAGHLSGRLQAALVDGRHPFLVVHNDPRHALAYLMAQGEDLADALRAVATGLATIRNNADVAAALVLTPEVADRHATDLEGMIADHLRLSRLHGNMSLSRQMDTAYDLNAWWKALDLRERALIQDAIGAYATPEARDPLCLVWQAALFRGDAPLRAGADMPVDITGKSRRLFWGPHIALPQANWRLSLALDFTPSALEHDFRLEVAAGHLLASTDISPQKAGLSTVTLDFAVDEKAGQPVCIALALRKAAFDGSVTLKKATLVELPN